MNLVLVCYTAHKTASAMEFCASAFSDIPVGHRILVCNQPGLVSDREAIGWTVLQGSNAFAEFSGWQEGLDHLRSLNSSESVLFANDTVNTHRIFTGFRRRSLVRELKKAPARSLVGFVDDPDNDIGDLSIDGLPLCGWVSSYCFLLGDKGLERLGHRLYMPEVIDRCVPGGAFERSFFSDCLSPDLRAHLRRWLFGGGWYRSEPLNPANQAFFTHKARAICAELHLSARCWRLGLVRRDPFERQPWSRAFDRRYERLLRRFQRGGAVP